ncbi:uncharacterized protein LOC114362551 [Ostrinia furnacalis]|uniref:uncharacterized protein LOC114362551 n=1 Tax=Ostrinia furnacalis TaxID=93504 RepID=UPI00103A6818|nr:uncharacterized protein LOC114362551 [Ostrinia furnacalis]XP_028173809.1 uncharacterized protein LOC114362551 [Ostrinia furnacalis]
MPKRKSEDSLEKLWKKFKKLEKKLRRHRSRSRSTSRSSDSCYHKDIQDVDHACNENNGEHISSNDCEILDECDILEPETGFRRLNSKYGTQCATEPSNESTSLPSMAVPETIPQRVSVVVAGTAEPSTSAQCVGTAPIFEESEPVEVALDGAILEVLGEDPTISAAYGPEIHKDLALRLQHVASNGLSKELRKELQEKYLLPSNCKLISAPALNAEIKAAISDMTAKRDKSIELRQKQTATAISCLGQALNILISKNNTDSSLIKLLMDTERILCDSQYNDSVVRRNFILSSLKKEMKDQLQNTKPDELLFGQNLSETIKTAKAINKSGAELKTSLPKQQFHNNNKKPTAVASTSKSLNWKGPYPARKPPNHPKAKEAPQSKRGPSNSSRHSQPQPTRGRR